MTATAGEAVPVDGVAIIGMSGRFPGADSVDELWRLLVEGREGRTVFSAEELAGAGVPERDIDDPAYVRSGRPIAGPDLFDAEFFGITPAEAELMDPQHRLLLEEAWRALEHAGHPPRPDGDRTGVFVAVSASGYLYERAGAQPGQVSDELQAAIGNDPGMAALRVSYELGLRGPSFTVHSACSSSLVAVHLAVQGLLNRECDLAVAGGASVRQLEPAGYRYEEGAILSPDGHCRPFDEAAAGTVSGDGVAVVVLKRLPEALADGDHVHAVILGSAVNNDGHAKVGFTAPSPDGQAEVIAEALAVAGVEPATIGYVEAHGTATPLGDPIEVQALTRAFGDGCVPGSCLLGSVKSNLGHLDAAAGVAGLIKATLAVEHRYIPPTVHFTRPNPRLDLARTPFRCGDRGEAWPASAHPARAGVSAFGIGGTNAHVVLQAAPMTSAGTRDSDAAVDGEPAWQVIPVSARGAEALDRASDQLARYLDDEAPTQSSAPAPAGVGAALPDVAYTLQTGRAEFPYRRAVVCADRAGASAALAAPARQVEPVPAQPPAVVFLFPGQGSQHAGMGGELYRAEPVFRDAVDECAEALLPHLGWDVRDLAFATGPDSDERLRQTLYTQPTMFTLDYALARLLMSWGVAPGAMAGHSLGELVAACLAGVFPLADALRLVAARARLFQDAPPGAMLSVLLDEAGVREVLDDLAGTGDAQATIAAVNAPGSCVVAGTHDGVEAARQRLAARGVTVRPLSTSHAFHTALVEPALPGLADVLRGITLRPPRLPFVSNVTGTWITDEQATDPEYWLAHTRQPVRFADNVATVTAAGGAMLVEVGPGSALSGLARAQVTSSDVVTLMPRGTGDRSEHRDALTALAELWRRGVPVTWSALHQGRPRQRVPLPTYPFDRRGYLLPRRSWQQGQGGARRDPERWAYAPVWYRSPLPVPDATGDPAVWLLLQDTFGVTGALADALRGRGHDVVAVSAGSGYSRRDADSFDVDPAAPDQLGILVDELRREGRVPSRVVHGWLLAGPGPDELTSDVLERHRRAMDLGFHTVVTLAQALDEPGGTGRVRIDVLTDDLQELPGGAVRRPERATVHGAVTVVPQEYRTVDCRAADITVPTHSTERATLTAHLTAELLATPDDPFVAYRHGRRWRRSFAPVQTPAGGATDWSGDGGYLVTGAPGALALAFTEHLVEQGARVFVHTGAVDDEDDLAAAEVRTKRLARLAEERPDQVVLGTGELTDARGARQVLDAARHALGRLRGVLHLVDERSSGLLALKTRDQSNEALTGRVASTLLLGDLLRGDDLDVFLVGSSTTGYIGGFGQAENCAAAAFLDAYACAAGASGLPAVAVDWGLWEWDDWLERKMAGLPEVREQYRRVREAEGIPTATGIAVTRAVLAAGLPQAIVSTVDFTDVLAGAAQLTVSGFTDALGAARPVAASDGWDPRALWPDDELAQSVAGVWRDMLGVAEVRPDDDFYELGGNSLFAIQITSRLRQQHGDFPMSAIFEAPTVQALADAIRTHQAESIGLEEFEALLREIEGLTGDEAEAELRGGHD